MNAPFKEGSTKVDLRASDKDILSEREHLIEAATEDTLWYTLSLEAADACAKESPLASLYAIVFAAKSFEQALIARIASRLGHDDFPTKVLASMLLPAFDDGLIADAARADLAAVVQRDPASERLIEPFLFFKGYAAIETHRIAHWYWINGKRDFALYLQNRSSEVFQTDIHPAAQIGKGIFLDHATGFVAGETVVIEDNVSILHGVTLGGTGTQDIDRHPKIRTGVLIGAGAQIIGNIEIGAYSRIAAGSLVTQDVPERSTAVGVPARIILGSGPENPAESMDLGLTYESFTYVI